MLRRITITRTALVIKCVIVVIEAIVGIVMNMCCAMRLFLQLESIAVVIFAMISLKGSRLRRKKRMLPLLTKCKSKR